ncbi:MAG: hypothetical protein C5B53_08710 [Candidatus Melainabacteria bacterium]|nr:MAG: hypothetical protein C5B53_08710 [Candidatus Melainabacteria bacterium]
MFTSTHEPYSMVFFSLLMLGQFSCLAIHAAFFEDSLQLNRLMNYARSLERFLASYQDRSSLNVGQLRKEAELGKQQLEETSQDHPGALTWIPLESSDRAAYRGRMTSRR